jgi:predicted enzyme related to lactoylglutathione lyase
VATRTSYSPGTFSWVDLATTDAAAAQAFYGGVFGWELEDAQDDGGVYTLCRVDGDAVCGLHELRAAGVGPSWMSYVTVADADAAAARATELGGLVVDDPFDVGDDGRMAVLADVEGAVLAVWQPRARIGAERVNDVGCLCMNELVTADMDTARAFYGGLFGWTEEARNRASAGPTMVFNHGHVNAAMFAAADDGPACWRPCFTVESTEGALVHVRLLGGRVLVEPVDIGHGSIAMAADPQGAVFSVFAGEIDP